MGLIYSDFKGRYECYIKGIDSSSVFRSEEQRRLAADVFKGVQPDQGKSRCLVNF